MQSTTSVYTSDLIEWHGPSIFRVVQRDYSPRSQQRVRRHGKTGNHIHAFLMDNGPAHTKDIIQHMMKTFSVKETNVQDAIYRDIGVRFLRLADRRVAANPVPPEHNPDTPDPRDRPGRAPTPTSPCASGIRVGVAHALRPGTRRPSATVAGTSRANGPTRRWFRVGRPHGNHRRG